MSSFSSIECRNEIKTRQNISNKILVTKREKNYLFYLESEQTNSPLLNTNGTK